MLKFFKMSLAAAFLLTAAPMVAPQAGSEALAQPAHAKAYGKKKAKRHYGKRGKYQYQYVPTSSGRPGAWR